jgi:hypothetical protein
MTTFSASRIQGFARTAPKFGPDGQNLYVFKVPSGYFMGQSLLQLEACMPTAWFEQMLGAWDTVWRILGGYQLPWLLSPYYMLAKTEPWQLFSPERSNKDHAIHQVLVADLAGDLLRQLNGEFNSVFNGSVENGVFQGWAKTVNVKDWPTPTDLQVGLVLAGFLHDTGYVAYIAKSLKDVMKLAFPGAIRNNEKKCWPNVAPAATTALTSALNGSLPSAMWLAALDVDLAKADIVRSLCGDGGVLDSMTIAAWLCVLAATRWAPGRGVTPSAKTYLNLNLAAYLVSMHDIGPGNRKAGAWVDATRMDNKPKTALRQKCEEIARWKKTKELPLASLFQLSDICQVYVRAKSRPNRAKGSGWGLTLKPEIEGMRCEVMASNSTGPKRLRLAYWPRSARDVIEAVQRDLKPLLMTGTERFWGSIKVEVLS